jgi:hypothetical protein
LIWAVADSAGPLHEEARKLLAWEDIEVGEEKGSTRFNDSN